jgi:hypothetical protein
MTDDQVAQFWAYVSRAAHFLVNTTEEPEATPGLIAIEETERPPSR